LNHFCRRLHGPCNVLIAVEAFCEILHQSAHVIMAYFMFTEQYLIPAGRCFHFQLIPSFGMNVGTFLNLSIGIDRIFSIIFPFFYSNVSRLVYLPVTTIPALCYGAAIMLATYALLDEQ
uniref:G protein-coupled receptor n=1 Tax=Gongylonema pulchrum TaxID=637853 RepID=A0A183EYA1_9BILA